MIRVKWRSPARQLGELVTPRSRQPRPSKHTIRVGEPREREREGRCNCSEVGRGRGRGLLLGHWASASHHKARPGTRGRDWRQLAHLSVTRCDQTSDNVQTLSWGERWAGASVLSTELGLAWAWLRARQLWPGPAFRGYQGSEIRASNKAGPILACKVQSSYFSLTNIKYSKVYADCSKNIIDLYIWNTWIIARCFNNGYKGSVNV